MLATLAAALRDKDDEGARRTKESAALRLVATLSSNDDHGRAKIAALALGHLLTKDILSLHLVLEANSNEDVKAAGFEAQANLESFLLVLLNWMGKGDFGSTIAQVVSAVLDRSELQDAIEVVATRQQGRVSWSAPLQQAVRSNAIEVASLRVHLLPVLFKRSSADYFTFLQTLGLERLSSPRSYGSQSQATDSDLLYASLQAGKDIGMLCETANTDLTQQDGVAFLPLRWIGRLLVRRSRSARLTGLSLLISSPSATKPLLPKALSLIKRNLAHYFADTDANFRSEVFSLFQRLVDRIRAITAVLARANNSSAHDEKGDDVFPAEALRYHQSFLEWLTRFLLSELRPTASYQRHISALKCLSVLVKSGLDGEVPNLYLSKSAVAETRWPIYLHLMTPSLLRTLLDLLCDPFDDVRQTASSILGIYATQSGLAQDQVKLALSRAVAAMLVTGRADQADGVAHLYTLLHSLDLEQRRAHSEHTASRSDVLTQLIERLEHMLRIAKSDLTTAVDRYPVHGLLTSARYVVCRTNFNPQDDSTLWDRLSSCLHTVWDVVKPVLCDDAPEGYLPEGVVEDVPDVTTKDTLSYCWRALKEASLLLGVLVSTKNGSSPTEEQAKGSKRLDDLCNLCFTQLAELRHRGAFSTVAQTWITCCVRSAGLSGPDKLHAWYGRVLSILHNQTTINTRRSAGLPSLLCGILVAEPSISLMTQVFNDLEAIARKAVEPAFAQEGSLAQVHAMNCMKDILKNSKLGEQSERHVPAALKLAADALRSEAWAVRNCGLMLFRAVIDRLLGTSDAYLEDDAFARKKLSAEQHPELLEIVLGLLATPAEATSELSTAGNEGVFPALQLLQRLSIPETQVPQVQQSVRALTASRVWHVRDKAARTYASLITFDRSAAEIEAMLSTSITRQNALHGALLAAKYIVRALAKTEAQTSTDSDSKGDLLRECMLLVEVAVQQLNDDNPCPVTRGAYLDLYSESLAAMQVDRSKGHVSTRPGDPYWLSSGRAERDWLFEEARIDAGLAVLLPSISTAAAAQLAFSDIVTAEQTELIHTLLSKLALQDPGACISFLRHIGSMLSTYPVSDRIEQTRLIIRACESYLENPSVHVQLKSQAAETLLVIADRVQSSVADSQQLCDVSTALGAASKALLSSSNQRYADLSLQLQAASIEYGVRHRQKNLNCEEWADMCCTAVAGSGFYSVEAAALAMSRVDLLWAYMASSETSSMFQRLCLAVYGLLNADDEEIRDIGSQAGCRILATESGCHDHGDLSSLVASQRLMGYMIRRWPVDTTFIGEAFSRAFGTLGPSDGSVAERLRSDAETDTALFAEEKQNLYIDEAREVKAWSQALVRLPAQTFPKVLLERLGGWVTNGLAALADRLAAKPDGALGWTTKSKFFVLGLQVVFGAEILLASVEQGLRIVVRPSTLRMQLALLRHASDNGGPNGLWVRGIDRVLTESTFNTLRRVHARLERLQDQMEKS